MMQGHVHAQHLGTHLGRKVANAGTPPAAGGCQLCLHQARYLQGGEADHEAMGLAT